MDESDKSKLRLFGKYKQADGDAFKIGYDRQVGKDLNQFEINPDDDGVVFLNKSLNFNENIFIINKFVFNFSMFS